ncbi:MAG: hypothetical protein A2086_06195 [Spirochaetes bacterium GWD1_27_9]|nr:MAG: hypothetical protein A2Z98_16850 [Spirochaetes bacterium GWB1_27_13]OHD27846.1 MAG: hypothetical protein A2Y34_15590 [Spirochaetes bacterium GWC1_27_15]OHD30858.1 MAG: hypothetical protein A2086_06195 [Spirochaetes bacterium GWD1_27_9]
MKIKYIVIILVLFSTIGHAKTMNYIYHGPETPNDTRFIYEWELLKMALEITKDSYGGYVMKPSEKIMNGPRRDAELMKDSGVVTIVLGIGTEERENLLTPVRIPLDKGLLGYRVFLINKKDKNKFSQIKSLDDLKKLTLGQGLGWGDIKVWEANGFKVMVGTNYDGLFNMIQTSRFDFFPRGILEIVDEYETRKEFIPEMEIEESILVYYPWPRYFFCANSPEGKMLAERVEVGLLKMIDNGEYNKIFEKHYGYISKKLNLKNRNLFKITNPLLSSKTPLKNSKLWYDIGQQ